MVLHFFCEAALGEEHRQQVDEIVARVPGALSAVLTPASPLQVNVIVGDEAMVRDLNRRFRGKDSTTDVLSFPLGDVEGLNGEIYIAWPRVLAQAADYGHSWQREFAYLLVHGLLHLLGYEHGAEPCPKMRKIEEAVLARLDLRR